MRCAQLINAPGISTYMCVVRQAVIGYETMVGSNLVLLDHDRNMALDHTSTRPIIGLSFQSDRPPPFSQHRTT